MTQMIQIPFGRSVALAAAAIACAAMIGVAIVPGQTAAERVPQGGDPVHVAGVRVVGDGISAQRVAERDGVVWASTVDQQRPAEGYPGSFGLLRLADDVQRIVPASMAGELPATATVVPIDGEAALAIYTDRDDDEQRVVRLRRISASGDELLFEFEHGGRGVLNPLVHELPSGSLYILIPNRLSNTIRRFIVDPDSRRANRIADIELPGELGVRTYDILQVGSRLLIPTGVRGGLYLVAIDLYDHSHDIRKLDSFDSIGDEPARNTRIFRVDGFTAMIGYFKPGPFSDRQGDAGEATGLVGEIVLATVDLRANTVTDRVVAAGHEAKRAAAHGYGIAQLGSDEFALVYTTVDRIHHRHLTGEYRGFVASHAERWTVRDGALTLQSRRDLEPLSEINISSDGAMLFRRASEPGALRIAHLR